MSTTQRLHGKIALITGGTSGLGFATAQQFIAEGAHVFITGRGEAELAAAADVSDLRRLSLTGR